MSIDFCYRLWDLAQLVVEGVPVAKPKYNFKGGILGLILRVGSSNHPVEPYLTVI